MGEVLADVLWNDWDTPPRVPRMPVLHLDGFDGPMDLLLELAERQRIDFGRMSILALAEQFVAALERLADRVPIERRTDWLVLAARLVLLRSWLLFPPSPEAAAEAERDAAAALCRIQELAFIRAAAAWLQARPVLGQDVFAAPPPRRAHRTGYVALIEACLAILRGREGRPELASVTHLLVPDLWRASDGLARIRAMLAEYPKGGELACFVPPLQVDASDHGIKARAAVIGTLLAGLELARNGHVSLRQAEPFGVIYLEPARPAT